MAPSRHLLGLGLSHPGTTLGTALGALRSACVGLRLVAQGLGGGRCSPAHGCRALAVSCTLFRGRLPRLRFGSHLAAHTWWDTGGSATCLGVPGVRPRGLGLQLRPALPACSQLAHSSRCLALLEISPQQMSTAGR